MYIMQTNGYLIVHNAQIIKKHVHVAQKMDTHTHIARPHSGQFYILLSLMHVRKAKRSSDLNKQLLQICLV